MWWILAGCVDTIRFPPDLWESTESSGVPDAFTGDTGTPPAPAVQIDAVTADGCIGDSAWVVQALTNGWTLAGAVALLRAGDGVVEDHPLDVVSTDPDGEWDSLSTGALTDGVQAAKQVDGVNSQFDCALDADALSYAIRIWDRSSGLSDCVVWGADPEAVAVWARQTDPDVTALGGCRAWPFEEAR